MFYISFTALLTLGQPNILVDGSGNARIMDFDSALVAHMQSTSHQQGYTPRLTAPEVSNDGTYSKGADIFSFAMVMIEVRCG